MALIVFNFDTCAVAYVNGSCTGVRAPVRTGRGERVAVARGAALRLAQEAPAGLRGGARAALSAALEALRADHRALLPGATQSQLDTTVTSVLPQS